MGCVPSNETQTTDKINQQTTANNINNNNNLIFTSDERLRLKEVWVIVKQNGLKKLGDDIMNKALEKNSSLKSYWQNLAAIDENNLLTFNENDANATKDLVWKQTYKQHGYKILDRIDQIIMIMVTRISTTDSDDSILNEQFKRIAENHSQYKIKQDHIDILIDSCGECLKNMMYQNGTEWTVKHAITWQKLLTLMTNQCSTGTNSSTTTTITTGKNKI